MIEAERCNCSICTKSGFLHLIVPRSNPDGMDVNVNCLEPRPASVRVVEFDGQHLKDPAHKLAHKSRDT